MPEYLHPGVYVEEVPGGARPIEAVGTAMPIFVGFTEKAQIAEELDGETIYHDIQGQAQLVTNWTQFVETFGGFVDGAYLPVSVYGYFLNGGGRCYIISVRTIPKAQAVLLNADGKPQLVVRARQAGFGGLKLRARVDVPELPAPEEGKKKEKAEAQDTNGAAPFTLTIESEKVSGGWQVKEVIPEVKLVEEEDEEGNKHVALSYKNNKPPKLVEILLPDADLPLAKLMPRAQEQAFQIDKNVLAPPTTSEFQGDAIEQTGIEGLEKLDDATMLVVPDLMTPMPGQKEPDLFTIKAVQTLMIAHCEKMGDRVAILDPPPNMRPQEVKKWRMETAGYDSSYAALYYPWIEISDPVTNRPKLMPPSGYIAGVWARTDNTRGVHKAPANEIIQGITGLAYNVTNGEQAVLNPINVNCIRAFPGRGLRIWGARTLASDPAWKYINVRRLFNMVEKSIEIATQWTVFEPNDPALWGLITRDVTAFLTTIWRTGALFGTTPGEAFFVKCDAENNPQETRDLGQLIIDIGMAPVKPAEFVIFRISQWAP